MSVPGRLGGDPVQILVEEGSSTQHFAGWILVALVIVGLLLVLGLALWVIGEEAGKRLRAMPGFIQQNRGAVLTWFVGTLVIDVVLVAAGLNVGLSIVIGLVALALVGFARAKDGKL